MAVLTAVYPAISTPAGKVEARVVCTLLEACMTCGIWNLLYCTAPLLYYSKKGASRLLLCLKSPIYGNPLNHAGPSQTDATA